MATKTAPPMYGTEKQIAWAMEIREDRRRELDATIAELSTFPEANFPENAESRRVLGRLVELRDGIYGGKPAPRDGMLGGKLPRAEQAGWWINEMKQSWQEQFMILWLAEDGGTKLTDGMADALDFLFNGEW